MKKILVAYYTQSGQIKDILDQYLKPFNDDSEYKLFFHQIKPLKDYPFPWTSNQFFDVFPEAVTEVGCDLHNMPKELIQSYDLIILGVQVWYLSPSIPITAFLQSEDFKSIAKNTSVVTINGCRNMWFMAHRSIVSYLEKSQAKHIGHLVLFDKVNNLISVITVMYWAFNAKKDKMWGIFPSPGISEDDIMGAELYGEQLKALWNKDKLDELQKLYIKSDGVIVLPHLMSMEHKAKRIFKIWTKFVLKKGGPENPRRKFRLALFKYYLLFMIYLLSPVATVVFYLTYPLFYKRIGKKIRSYQELGN